jgi:hypothetical protein
MPDESSEVEFFGMRIKVKDPKLAELLNSDVSENVVVIGRRTRDLFSVEVERADAQVGEQAADDAQGQAPGTEYEPPAAAGAPSPEGAPEPQDDPPFST